MSNITDQQYKEAFKSMYEYEKEIADYNAEFIKKFGENVGPDFEQLCDDCRITGKIEFVEKPKGDPQDENCGVFKNVHVDQHSVGDSGDSYAGAIYANVNDRWVRVYYEC